MALPPTDILIAIATMVALSIALGIILHRQLRPRPVRWATGGAVLAVALLALHATWLNGNQLIVGLVRSPNAIVWANFSPLFAAVLIACAWRTMAVRWQRWVMLAAVSGICVFQGYALLFGPVPATKPARVANAVHRQSTLSSCSAAAAATLLGTMGIETTESEMADLCLTRAGGTLQLGLYRGLRLKSPHARVEFLNDDFEAVINATQPVIVSLGTPPSGLSVLQRHAGHSVVVMSHDADGQLDIADPMTGSRYRMTTDRFRESWAGEAMQLVSTNGP